MIMVATAMFVCLMMAAAAIDAARWYQKHHQAQVAADAASLAAANCLANSGNGHTCTSTTDTTDAIGVAQTIASTYGVTLTANQISFAAGKVTVNDGTTSPSLFASAAGIKTASQSAGAAAGYQAGGTTTTTLTQTVPTVTTITNTTPTTTTQTTTTPVTGSPLALFAMDSNCSDYGVNQQGGSDTINGGVWSNSSLFLDPGGSSYESLTYGTGGGCKTTVEGGGGTYNNGQPTQATADITSWPAPYGTSSAPLPACTTTYSGGGTWQIGNQPASTPQVFCYPGGTILLTGWQNYSDDTFICGTFTVQGGGFGLSAENYPTNKLLIYATGTGTAATIPSGMAVIKGDIFAPNGTIAFNSGSNSFTGLLEGQDVGFNGGSEQITGDGPTTYGYVTNTTTTSTTLTTTTVQTTTGVTTTTVTNTTPASDGLVQ